MAGLYIHIPYCKSKCLYCDFYSGGVRQARWGQLIDCLLAEMESREEELTGPVTTLYIGGGTPSLAPSDCLGRLLSGLADIAAEKWEIAEATIEANPDDITPSTVREWADMGVTRLSIGVQSLNDNELRAVGRRHDGASARAALESAMHSGLDVSIDLIFGLPGQTVESWRNTVDEAAGYRPHHISAYTLMLEPGTALSYLYDRGRVELPGEEENIAMFSYLTSVLAERGYRQYEISNYSLPGHSSRHNSSYWAGVPYVGIGPAAHSYDGGRLRRANAPDIHGYLDSCGHPAHTVEHLDDEMLRDEYLLTRLRTAEGIDFKDFENRFGKDSLHILVKSLQCHIAAGHIIATDRSVSLSRKGIMTADDIISGIASKF